MLGSSCGLLEKNPAAIIAPQISELPPGKPKTLLCESGSECLTIFVLVAGCLKLCRRSITDRAREPFVTIPVCLFQRRVFDLVDLLARSTRPDVFGLVETNDAFGHGVVAGVARVADESLKRNSAGYALGSNVGSLLDADSNRYRDR